MSPRLLFTVAMTVSLIGLYALYSVGMQAVVIIPVRSEEPIEEDAYNQAQRPAEHVRVATMHVPKRPWAAKSKYMVRAGQAFIYTEHWQPVLDNNKRIRFDKFAMVWMTTDKDGEEQAVSIVSDHALLEFAFAFDEKAPNPGRVVRAVLEGDVEIAGPDGLSVIGHHFIFDEAELNLYTLNPVNFRFQSHRGSASRMAMKLIPAQGAPGKDRPHVYGIQTIQLIANPTLQKNSHVLLEVQMPQGKEVRTINVKCAGDLDYTVATNQAVFTNDVYVWSGLKEKRDRMDCHKLTMQFVPKQPVPEGPSADTKPASDGRSRAGSEYQHLERDLEFSWLLAESLFEAEGRAGDLVKITSTSQKATAYLGRLKYVAASRLLTMSSQEQGGFVRVIQNGSELIVPEIEAQLGNPSAKQFSLASLVCLGPGELKYVDEKTGKLAFVATWQKQLTKKIDEATNLDLVELEENAHFGQPELRTGLLAESIKIWLVPFLMTSPLDGTAELAESPQPEPKRLLARHGVALRSPQLCIKRTNELDIVFENPVDTGMNSSTRKPRSQLRPVSLTTPENRPIGFASIPAIPDGTLGPPVEIPFDSATSTPIRKMTKSLERSLTKPILVSADRIEVRLRRIIGTQQPEMLAVHSEGRVEVSQERIPGEKPMTLVGDVVDLENESANREVVHVFGTPAIIQDQRIRIEGKSIHLDRGDNRAWVEGSGWLQLPIPEQSRIPGLEGVTNRELSVHWNESMDFDGLNARFIGRVEAKLGHASMDCELMKLQLLDRLEFQTTSSDIKPAIRSIECRENVKFKNATYSKKNKKQLNDNYRGKVGSFTWDHSTGVIVAQGPGEIQVWRRKQQQGTGVAQRDTIQANRAIAVEIAEWDYTRIQFEGKLKGRVDGESNSVSKQQGATIEDRVKVTHGPVSMPNETVNQDKLPSKAGTIHCDRLQFVNYPVSEKNPIEYRELVGYGNAEVEGQVEGRRFTASADEISYDGSKGLYVLRAYGKQNARLTEIGRGNVPGQRIEFNPITRSLKVDQATGGQWSQGQ